MPLKRLALKLYIKHYKNNPSVRNFFALLSLDILVKAGMVVLIPLYTQFMERSDFGLFNYLFFYISTVSLIINFGLYVPHTKLLNQSYPQEHPKINGTIFLLFFFPNLIIASVLLGFQLDAHIARLLFYQSNVHFEKYRYALQFAVFASAFNFMLNAWLLATRKIQRIQKIQIFRFLVHLPVLIGLYFHAYEDAVSFRLWTFYGLDFFITLFVFISLQYEIQWKIDKELLQPIFKIAFPVFLNACLAIILNFLDKLYLENSSFSTQMPSYALATQLASIVPIISLSFLNVMLPDFLKVTDIEQNFGHTQRTEKRLFALLFVAGIGIWLATALGMLFHIFPASYNDILWILIILLTAKIIEALAQLYVRYTILLEKTWLSFIFSLLISPLILFLNIELVPLYGMNACVVVIFINSLLTYIFFRGIITWQVQRFIYSEQEN